MTELEIVMDLNSREGDAAAKSAARLILERIQDSHYQNSAPKQLRDRIKLLTAQIEYMQNAMRGALECFSFEGVSATEVLQAVSIERTKLILKRCIEAPAGAEMHRGSPEETNAYLAAVLRVIARDQGVEK